MKPSPPPFHLLLLTTVPLLGSCWDYCNQRLQPDTKKKRTQKEERKKSPQLPLIPQSGQLKGLNISLHNLQLILLFSKTLGTVSSKLFPLTVRLQATSRKTQHFQRGCSIVQSSQFFFDLVHMRISCVGLTQVYLNFFVGSRKWKHMKLLFSSVNEINGLEDVLKQLMIRRYKLRAMCQTLC